MHINRKRIIANAMTAGILALTMCANVFAAQTSERSVIKVTRQGAVTDSDGTPANSELSGDGPVVTMEPESSEISAANGTEFRVNMKLSNMNSGFIIFSFERAEESYNADGSTASGSIAELQRVEYGNADDFIIENKTSDTQLIPSETSNELVSIKNAFIEYDGNENVRPSGEATIMTLVYKKTGNGIFKPVIKDLSGCLFVMSDYESAPVSYIVTNPIKLSDADGNTESSATNSPSANTNSGTSNNNTSGSTSNNNTSGSSNTSNNNEISTAPEENNSENNKETAAEETTESTTENTANTDGSLFDDISARPWAVDAINELAEKGIINGVGDRRFAPDNNSRRADFIIIADKILGLTGSSSDNFADVRADKYYANYVGLAKEAGIASGYSDNTFAPENTITRQDMMVLVGKMLEYKGIKIEGDTSALDKFSDAGDISEYAKPYVAFLTQQGIVSGTGDNIEPKALMTRAQMAVLMKNVNDKM